MQFAVTVVSPPGYLHSAAFSEVAETIHYSLRSLGHDSIITTEGKLPGRQHIVLGSNLLPYFPLRISDDAILYNLEQVAIGSPWFQPDLVNVLRRYRVWDYSKRNAAALDALGVKIAQIVPSVTLLNLRESGRRQARTLMFSSLAPSIRAARRSLTR
jgi:hypothetical protein